MANTDAFFQTIESDVLPRIIAFGGEERVFVDDALDIIRRRALEGGLADFNHDRTSGRDREPGEIIAMCKTLPTMAPRRLVEVADAQDLRDDALAIFQRYVEDPCPETVLCLVFRARGSTPQSAGALMVVDDAAQTYGTIGGGCVEAEVRRRAFELLGRGESGVMSFKLDHDYGWDDGLICGGTLELAVGPLADTLLVTAVLLALVGLYSLPLLVMRWLDARRPSAIWDGALAGAALVLVAVFAREDAQDFIYFQF